MPKITQDDATRIADKLRAQYKEGGKHKLAMVYHEGRKITQFGIRRDKTAGHDYISDQIFMSKQDCITFGNFEITYIEWVARMREKGVIPPQPSSDDPEVPKKASRKRHGK